MAVQIADRRLGARRRQAGGRGAHGDRLKGGWGPTRGPYPGWGMESGDVPAGQTGGRSWVLALDPKLWPVYKDDQVVDADSGQEWLVTSADLMTNSVDPAADFISIKAHLQVDGHTAP